SFRKNFHVSPFMDMDHTYDWRFTHPGLTDGDSMSVQTTMLKKDKLFFDAKLTLVR
ncbi:unnamed protein product, partial [Discosporangium mesarthrocarpum]